MSILISTVADVLPFAGLRYDPDVVGSLSDVLCPPFDIIPEALQRELHHRSPYNAVRLERGMALEEDSSGSSIYTRAAEAFASWQWEGVLAKERVPSLYLHRHRFSDGRGRTLERWGIGARLRLEELDRGVVLPHEETRSADKADRLALMEAGRANFSPVMVLYRQGPERRIAAAIQNIAKRPPAFDGAYEHDQHLTLWVADSPDLIEAVRDELRNTPLFIADGHHRYETALKYRDQLRDQAGSWSGEEPYNYVMMTLIDFADPGLLVQPYHRMVGGLASATLVALRSRLLEVFRATQFPEPPAGPEALESAVARHSESTPVLGLLEPGGEAPLMLSLPAEDGRGGATSADEALRRFEGWILHQEVLNRVLGSEAERHIEYTHDPREAWERVSTGEQQMAFFLRPMPMDLFETLVSAGVRLPPKSTYFYPKIPTGLVFHLLEVQ